MLEEINTEMQRSIDKHTVKKLNTYKIIFTLSDNLTLPHNFPKLNYLF